MKLEMCFLCSVDETFMSNVSPSILYGRSDFERRFRFVSYHVRGPCRSRASLSFSAFEFSLLILEFLVTCSFVRSDTVLSGDRDTLIYSQPASPTLTMYHVRMLAQYAMLVSVARHYSSVCCREWKEVSEAL